VSEIFLLCFLDAMSRDETSSLALDAKGVTTKDTKNGGIWDCREKTVIESTWKSDVHFQLEIRKSLVC
jgi:hypothetical protein